MNYRRNFLKQCAGLLSGLSIFPFLRQEQKPENKLEKLGSVKSHYEWGNPIVGITFQPNPGLLDLSRGVVYKLNNSPIITCYYQDGTSKIVKNCQIIDKGLGSYEFKEII